MIDSKYVLFNKNSLIYPLPSTTSAQVLQMRQCLDELRFWIPGVARIANFSDMEIFNLGLPSIQDLMDVIVKYGPLLKEVGARNLHKIKVVEDNEGRRIFDFKYGDIPPG